MKKIATILIVMLSITAKAQTITPSAPHMCNATTITLTGSPSGGTWSTNKPMFISVSSGGVVSSHRYSATDLTANVTYTVAGVGSATTVVTIDGSAPTICCIDTAYIASTDSFIYSAYGGVQSTWSVSDTTLATFWQHSDNPRNITIYPLSAGTLTIFYTRSNGCYYMKNVTIQ